MALIAGDPVMIDCPQDVWTRLNQYLPGGDGKVLSANVHFQKTNQITYFFTFRAGADVPTGDDAIMVRDHSFQMFNTVAVDLYILCRGGNGRVRLEAVA